MKWSKVALIAGYLLVVVGLVLPSTRSNVDYVLSPFAEIPISWISIFVATLCGILVFAIGHRSLKPWSAGLALSSSTLAVCLPLLIAPYYYGYGDPMTHLGYLKSLLRGEIGVFDLFYPIYHTFSVEIVQLLGVGPRRGLLLAAACFLSVWVIGAGALIRQLGPSPETGVAILAPVVFLPINPISIYPRPHPATLSVFFVPLVFYAFLRRNDLRFGVLFAVLFATLILLHPLIAVITALLLLAWPLAEVSLVTVGERFNSNWTRKAGLLSGLLLAIAGLVAIQYYLVNRPEFQNNFVATITLLGRSVAGAGAASRASSLSSVGGSLLMFGLKLGTKYVLFGLLSLVAFLVAVRRGKSNVASLAIAVAPIVPAIAVFVATGKINLWSRFLAVIMVFLTVLGGFGLQYVQVHLRGVISTPAARLATTIVLVTALAVSFPILHPSPYIYSSNERVPQDYVESYDHVFTHSDRDSSIIELRKPTYRFHHALYGASPRSVTFNESRAVEARDRFSRAGLPRRNSASYVVVSDADREREVELYAGFRFSAADFRYLNSTSSAVYDSGDGTVYFHGGSATKPTDGR